MPVVKRVIVLGLDGLDPRIAETLLAAGELPNLARLREQGGFSRVATTYPAQTPVAWSTFATGLNPGGHGIFDFIRRDPTTYLPELCFTRYERRSAFLPPRLVNLRQGATVWQALSQAGMSSTIMRCPCTYPAEDMRGRLLAGLGVPDLRGGLGTSTFFSSDNELRSGESEQTVQLKLDDRAAIATALPGPRDPRTGHPVPFDLLLRPDPEAGRLLVCSAGSPEALEVREQQWSGWLKMKFKMGLLQSLRGMVRFFLARLHPTLDLYASPINFDPEAPPFPISSPVKYARELADEMGTYYTAGMAEDHVGLNNGRFNESAFLDQCEEVVRQREQMMLHELGRFEEGLFFCLFDTPDRIQHMFWRYRERDHPANGREALTPGLSQVIEEHYRRCDAAVGRALGYLDDRTLLIVLSDHGFGSFRRGVHLNTWLHDQGLLALRPGTSPGAESDDLLRGVDWSRTRAYALGLSGLYLNRKGREAQGIVGADEAPALTAALIKELTGLVDPARGQTAVRSVVASAQVYAGPHVAEAPDLLVNFADGYRASWGTALGAVPAGHFEDNVKKWSGDHLIDPTLVPGVLFMNRPFRGHAARLVDLAPTILAALGVPKAPAMEGEQLFP